MAAGVDDAQRLVVAVQALQQFFVRQLAQVLDFHPAVEGVQFGRVGGQFGELDVPREKLLQRRLGGGAKDRRAAVVLHQFLHGQQGGLQVLARQVLGFVKDDHAAGDVVQFAGGALFVGEERFKKLDVGRDHDGHIPVLGGQFEFLQHVVGLIIGRFALPIKIGMVL